VTNYPNGKLKQQATYKIDRLQGPFTTYYKNGNIQYQGNYIKNKRTGTWSYYDEKGTLYLEEDYQSGIIIEKRPIDQ
jgi:antitoxin component YwqK of YwqJK toxin-antitoxin module